MGQDARAGDISPDGHGAIPSKARRSPITFFMRPVQLAGAGGSLMCTLRSVRLIAMGFLGDRALPQCVFRHISMALTDLEQSQPILKE